MHWAGTGAELWRVRVDLFAEDNAGHRVSAAHESLRSLLTEGEGGFEPGELGADGGLGVAGGPVVGLLFWVRGDDVGQAATVALETAERAAVGRGVGPELYDLTIIPHSAVVFADNPRYPARHD
jgi:hypothetical protein